MTLRIITAVLAIAFSATATAGNYSSKSDHATSHATNQETTHSNGQSSAQTDAPTIVDLAVDAGTFTTLVTALKAADLVGTLQGQGPFTVFAPTDEAFAALPEGALQALLDNPEQLAQVLTLHVVAGRAGASDVVGLDSVTSLQGSELAIDTSAGVSVAGANVVQADINATNGVIHVIDKVILPQS